MNLRHSQLPCGNGCTQHCILKPALSDGLFEQMLTPVFDPEFSEYSYGFRPQRSAGQAVKRLHSSIKSGHKIAVDVDLSKFFDRVNHDLLMNRLGRKVQDKAIKRLIGKYLRAGISENGWCTRTTQGVPQGGPLCRRLYHIGEEPSSR